MPLILGCWSVVGKVLALVVSGPFRSQKRTFKLWVVDVLLEMNRFWYFVINCWFLYRWEYSWEVLTSKTEEAEVLAINCWSHSLKCVGFVVPVLKFQNRPRVSDAEISTKTISVWTITSLICGEITNQSLTIKTNSFPKQHIFLGVQTFSNLVSTQSHLCHNWNPNFLFFKKDPWLLSVTYFVCVWLVVKILSDGSPTHL